MRDRDPELVQRLNEVLDALEARPAVSDRPELSVSEVELLLQATGPALDRLLRQAARLRDIGLERAGRPGVITFSKKIFLPITNMCRDRCHYCTFVESPLQMLRQGKPLYMSSEQVLAVATQGAALGCKEALFTLGDRPEDRWPEAREWLDAHGYDSTLHYVRDMAQMVLEHTGMLPHLNPGVMTAQELEWLRPIAPSMGMMLETTSVELWSEKGRAHYGSPDKEPRVRLQVIEDAGMQHIPFTTGILVGIGETMRDRAESLLAIRDSHDRWGHVQEVIVQNFRAKPHTAMQATPDLESIEYLAAIATARLVMGPDARLQVPPNLANQAELELLVRAGIDDWGGVSPLTADHVNPERPWPSILALRESTAQAGFVLHERLTAYPPYLAQESGWVDPGLTPAIAPLMDVESGLANEGARPTGSSTRAHSTRTAESAHVTSFASRSVEAVLDRARQQPESISDADLALLLTASGDALDTLTDLANDARRYSVGEAVTVVVNGTIDPSGFGEDVPRAEGLADIARMAGELRDRGATEICVQGRAPTAWGADAYLHIAREVTAAARGVHLHAFRPADIVDGAARKQLGVPEYLELIKAAGVDTVPGTGIKILDEAHRRRVAPLDVSVGSWMSTIMSAHRAGLRSTSIIVYGLGESAELRIRHLRSLGRIQQETGGFTEIVVMPAQKDWTPLVDSRSAIDEHRAMYAVARLALNTTISHVQVAWPRLDMTSAVAMLRSGADDLGGRLLQVGSVSGGGSAQELSVENLQSVRKSLGRPIRQRTTLYGVPEQAKDRLQV
ncbi:7,8-didemethyl-8-hydroxy-5-deazariboflavin synthase CofG [Leucobacter sp. Z1108]|uniref:7,8-didemethyl-8-hydroxy-5-deazariboflavin synthase CofG n=1 Tax=Leucobacter sp. Z1108 TaxID=3439066 RepID=UPI003F37A479